MIFFLRGKEIFSDKDCVNKIGSQVLMKDVDKGGGVCFGERVDEKFFPRFP